MEELIFWLKVTIFISLFSFCSPMPSMMSERSHTRMSPASVPVTAWSVSGMKTVLVNLASDLSLWEKSFFSILGA